MININTLVLTIVAWVMLFFFAGIEVAFSNANRLSIELKKKQGLNSGIILSQFLEHPAEFIGTTIVGFTFFLVVFGLLVGETFLPLWNWLIVKIHIPSGYVNIMRLFVETLLSTIFILEFGEFLPKSIFRSKSDKLLSFFSGVTRFFADIFSPVASFFTKFSEWILKYIFNVQVDANREKLASADTEHFFLQTGDDNEEKQELNTELFEAALSLPKVKIRECLVPRKEIEGIDMNSTMEDMQKKFVSTRLSKLIVYDGNLDHVTGYVHQLDLFKNPSSIKSILLPIPAVPES
ncbi:MAG: CNNM domain-containing protein, partial [Bacteroidota bacterium]